MTASKHENRIAREAALSLLYSSDIAETDLAQVIEEGLYPADDLQLSDYAERLALGVDEMRASIDARLSETSENWAVERMSAVDRAILRLAVYEIVYVEEVPVSVSINEAVELAKAFGGGDDSSRFVNGVLGRIARGLEGQGADQGAAGLAGSSGAGQGEAGQGESGQGEAGTAQAPALEGPGALEGQAPDEQ